MDYVARSVRRDTVVDFVGHIERKIAEETKDYKKVQKEQIALLETELSKSKMLQVELTKKLGL